MYTLTTFRPRRNEQHFADDIFKRIFFNENIWISINIALKFVPKGPINTIPALVQIMAWRRSGDKPLSEPMMVRLPTHICVTRPQWVNHIHTSTHINIFKSWQDGRNFAKGIFIFILVVGVFLIKFNRTSFQTVQLAVHKPALVEINCTD